MWGVVKDKCYADKPEIIDTLKDNICEAIDEIQLHTIDNVLKNWRDRVGYSAWPAKTATLDVLRPVFEDDIISLRADVVWPARSCDLTPSDYYLWGAVKDKCYADKPEIIDALKDNIREAIDEIQLHTIYNVGRLYRLLHGQPRRALLTGNSNKKEI